MSRLTDKILEKLEVFEPYMEQSVQLDNTLFSFSKGKVANFASEIRKTAEKLNKPETDEYCEYYAELLVKQFDNLLQAVKNAEKNANLSAKFRSDYRFAKNIHNLPYEKRLAEYRKALRALNDKLVWLSEQNYLAEPSQRTIWLSQIQETEYRKNKCIQAIEELG